MNEIYQLLSKRNALETSPFVSVYESNHTLLNQLGSLEQKYSVAEREVARLQQELQDVITSPNTAPNSGNSKMSAAASAALKNETRLRDKLEKIQEELNAKLKIESDDRATALKIQKELAEMKDLTMTQERTIANLKAENERSEKAIEHLTNEVISAKSDKKLAEQQYEGLKTTIRSLQEDNDELQRENRELETRLVTDKSKMVDEMNKLTDMVDSLKKEVEMLRSYQKQETKHKSWFGSVLKGKTQETKEGEDKQEDSRKWGNFDVVVPSCPKQIIKAHKVEGTCLRYNESGSLIATSSHDSTVKIWDASTGTVRATLRGTSGHPMMSCDIDGTLAIGSGTDKTCRVWQTRTERMVSCCTQPDECWSDGLQYRCTDHVVKSYIT